MNILELLKKKNSIKSKIQLNSLMVALAAALVIGLTIIVVMQRAVSTIGSMVQTSGDEAVKSEKELLEQQAVERLLSVAEAKAETLDGDLYSIISGAEIVAAAAEDLYADPDEYGRIRVSPPDMSTAGKVTAQLILAEWTDPEAATDEIGLLGNLASVMIHTVHKMTYVTATSIGTESGIIITCDRRPETKKSLAYLDPTERAWYKDAVEAGTLTWSDLFDDAYGRGLCISCVKPIYDPKGTLKGVISYGCTLEDIAPTLTDLHIGNSEYAFVIDDKGNIIMSGREEDSAGGSVTGIRNLLEDDDTDVQAAAEIFTSGEKGVATLTLDGEEVYAAYVPLENQDWTAVTVVSTSEVMSAANQGEAILTGLTRDIRAYMRKSALTGLFVILAAFVVAAVLALLFSGMTADVITRPITKLNDTVEEISAGDLSTRVHIRSGDEIEELGHSVNRMADSLSRYIEDLTQVTAEKERISTELNLARAIQSNMLPHAFPPFPDRKEIDLYASMEPAKEVGGDFYDFLLLDEDHLALVVADVSGKGVPAALFMMIAKTLINNTLRTIRSPGKVLGLVNNMLCENSRDDMFVTVWLGIVELSTGDVTYANAGHENPLLYHGGKWKFIRTKHSFVLGGMEDMVYKDHSLHMDRNDVLFQYTDGVTEASTKDMELFGDERLLAAAGRADAGDSARFLEEIRKDIRDFVQDADPFDDITMLCFRYASDDAAADSGCSVKDEVLK